MIHRVLSITVILLSVFITQSPLIKINAEAKNLSPYKQGWNEGVNDGHAMVFHQNKISADQKGFDQFSQGYIDGWRSTCKEMGLTTGPDSGCELSMDAGNP